MAPYAAGSMIDMAVPAGTSIIPVFGHYIPSVYVSGAIELGVAGAAGMKLFFGFSEMGLFLGGTMERDKMEIVNKTYYDGFEGEPEIQFIFRERDDTEILIIWEGYFDQIMQLMTCDEQGWTGLAYCYNMCTGWYEESPWQIEDLQMALEQFEEVDSAALCDEAVDILTLICNRFSEAINKNHEVFIVRE